MKTLVTDIGLLAGIGTDVRKEGAAMSEVGVLKDAWLLIGDEQIAGFGAMADGLPSGADECRSAAGRMVIPTFCDSHTHAVWAGSREREFEDKIRGLSYAEIAANGGGILNSADLLHNTSEDELFGQSIERVREMMAAGSGTPSRANMVLPADRNCARTYPYTKQMAMIAAIALVALPG